MRRIQVGAKFAVAIVVLAVAGIGPVWAEQPSESPVELVRQTILRETAPAFDEARAIFEDRKETPRGSQTKLIVETRDGTAGMKVAVNGKPLTPEEREAEEARLSGLVSNPDALKKKQKSEKEDEERTLRIMRALPDAFLFEPDSTAVGTQEIGKAGDRLVRLKFRPNPKFVPPSHVEQVLTGLQGYILIDADQHRIAKIDGTLGKDVGFGWGILGRLDRGGHFLVEQAEVIPGRWEVTHMSVSFTGKELLFKSINISFDEVFHNFRPAPPNLTFSEGVVLLKKQGAEIAENLQPGHR